jgi:hypothetical protein
MKRSETILKGAIKNFRKHFVLTMKDFDCEIKPSDITPYRFHTDEPKWVHIGNELLETNEEKDWLLDTEAQELLAKFVTGALNCYIRENAVYIASRKSNPNLQTFATEAVIAFLNSWSDHNVNP